MPCPHSLGFSLRFIHGVLTRFAASTARVCPIWFSVGYWQTFKVKGQLWGRGEAFKEREKDTWVIEKYIWKCWKGPRINNIRMEAWKRIFLFSKWLTSHPRSLACVPTQLEAVNKIKLGVTVLWFCYRHAPLGGGRGSQEGQGLIHVSMCLSKEDSPLHLWASQWDDDHSLHFQGAGHHSSIQLWLSGLVAGNFQLTFEFLMSYSHRVFVKQINETVKKAHWLSSLPQELLISPLKVS